MVTLRREMSDTRGDYDYRDNRRNTLEYAKRTKAAAENAPPEYLDYLWGELNRSEPRKILRPDEYQMGFSKRDNRSYNREAEKEATIINRRAEGARANYYMEKQDTRPRLDRRGIIAIAVYFLIVATIVTLIIVNGSGGLIRNPNSRAELPGPTGIPVISSDAVNMLITDDGTQVPINMVETTETGGVSDTNWFDKLCDALSFVAGG